MAISISATLRFNFSRLYRARLWPPHGRPIGLPNASSWLPAPHINTALLFDFVFLPSPKNTAPKDALFHLAYPPLKLSSPPPFLAGVSIITGITLLLT